MPWTLYWYILKDLLKVLVAATTVLVLVISMTAAIKPLSDGLLGPALMVKYVLYLTPTMLGFTVPFAGALAGTLVFIRLASDNELTACRASGISYQMLLLPVVFLGMAITLGGFYLSNWVVPTFYARAALMLQTDLSQALVSQLDRGRPVTLKDMVLYADQVDDSHAPPKIPGSPIQPTKLIRLRGVAAGTLDDRGRLRSDTTAEKADLVVYHVDGQTWITMRLENVTYHDADRGELFHVQEWSIPQMRLPSPLSDNPRFMSWPQLQTLGSEPERFDRVRLKKNQLATQIAKEQILRSIESSLTNPNPGSPLTLIVPGEDKRYIITAPQIHPGPHGLKLTAQDDHPVRIDYYLQGVYWRRIEAAQAILEVQAVDPSSEPWVRVELKNAHVFDAQVADRGTQHASMTLMRSRWPQNLLNPLANLSGYDLQKQAKAYWHVKPVREAALDHQRTVDQLFRKVVALLHERAAQAISGLLVLLLSVVLSIKMVGRLPLVVYFWCFIPTIIVVIISHSGMNIATDSDVPRTVGLMVMWSGNLTLAAAVGIIHWRLSRV